MRFVAGKSPLKVFKALGSGPIDPLSFEIAISLFNEIGGAFKAPDESDGAV